MILTIHGHNSHADWQNWIQALYYQNCHQPGTSVCEIAAGISEDWWTENDFRLQERHEPESEVWIDRGKQFLRTGFSNCFLRAGVIHSIFVSLCYCDLDQWKHRCCQLHTRVWLPAVATKYLALITPLFIMQAWLSRTSEETEPWKENWWFDQYLFVLSSADRTLKKKNHLRCVSSVDK